MSLGEGIAENMAAQQIFRVARLQCSILRMVVQDEKYCFTLR